MIKGKKTRYVCRFLKFLLAVGENKTQSKTFTTAQNCIIDIALSVLGSMKDQLYTIKVFNSKKSAKQSIRFDCKV